MKKRWVVLLTGIVAVCLLFIGCQKEQSADSSAGEGEDWPQFLGPNRDSTSSEKGLLRRWPEEGPEVLWTVSTESGYGGPVIKDGKVYLLDRDGRAGDSLRCFDLYTGEELWKYSYDSPGHVSYPGSRSVPIVDDAYVYSCNQNGELYCIDINTHEPLWNKNIWTDFGGTRLPRWGISQCPLLYGDLLIIASQAPEAGVVAYNKLSGEVVWKTPHLGNISYASPSIAHIEDEAFIVMVQSKTNTATDRGKPITLGNVVGMDPETGEAVWVFDQWECIISIPSAVDAGNNRLLLTGGYDLGAMMIEVSRNPDGTYTTEELYRTMDFGAHTKPPLLYKDYFYAQYGTNYLRDGLCCMNMDGELMWKTGTSPSFDKGSMILVDKLILATDGARQVYLIKPDPDEFKTLASAELLGRGQNWAPIAYADGKLLVKDQSQMLCLQVGK